MESELTKKEKDELVFDALEAIAKVTSQHGYDLTLLTNAFRSMMIDCYIEGARKALEKVK
jgi:predicted Zn-ribbon and HTH transcriptional regulator